MALKNIRSQVLRIYPPDTNTDEVISGKYKYDELDLKKLAVHAFESIDPTFYTDAQKVKSPILVAANNFGCGSSREQAPQVIMACDVSCIIAESYARIFYRNGFNIGLPLIECKGISKAAKQGDELEVDFAKNLVINHTTGQTLPMKPIPEFMQQLLEAGGLMPYLKKQHEGKQ
ncbi:LeuD/DmdB family oxidoreductase small subunit [Methanocella arvoryzae]|uniref:3-isopropylmalate dehydratase, small subunit n=1 Tax=Methanocella arvoryzae (strain DSM 22066 / NBRC 105507 / MRE50) TaxID=351160 RepID=Q0W0T9_METAR|nr:3-isopropylmalate dehydratase [Methanocella arvoryzae]CAJ38004.1 3-isopropylmalate dehydratase, small subunit [Methanocella arvoryzae MRE50]